MKRLMIAVVILLPIPAARAQIPTPADMQQASAGTIADLGSLIVNLRAQLLADQRELSDLQKRLTEAKKPEVPKP